MSPEAVIVSALQNYLILSDHKMPLGVGSGVVLICDERDDVTLKLIESVKAAPKPHVPVIMLGQHRQLAVRMLRGAQMGSESLSRLGTEMHKVANDMVEFKKCPMVSPNYRSKPNRSEKRGNKCKKTWISPKKMF